MQKTVLGLVVLALIILPTSVSAETNINISNNGGNSKSSVKVNNSGTSSKSENNETHIVIDNNGERKEYHGSDDSVHLESSNGNNRITVSGSNTPSSTPNPTQKPSQAPTTAPTSSPSASPSPTPQNTITLEGDVLGESTQKENDTMFEYFKRFFTSIWVKLF